jgi:hypothetical protein
VTTRRSFVTASDLFLRQPTTRRSFVTASDLFLRQATTRRSGDEESAPFRAIPLTNDRVVNA